MGDENQKKKDWLNDGLDSVEKILDFVQESYDALPDKAKSQELLRKATKIIETDVNGSYQCRLDNSQKAIGRVLKLKRLDDPEKSFKRIERAISKDVRQCFKVEYGDII